MKVTLINTADAGGGAPAACMRLMKALRAEGVDTALVVSEKKTTDPAVKSIADGVAGRLIARFNFLFERLPFIWFSAKERSVRFAFSTANTGFDISRHPDVLNADVLHLHWTNFGFLSVADLKKLLALGKPVVWTLHDMWAFTGGCHYTGGCTNFEDQCGNCWMLRQPGAGDLSHKGWLNKADMYRSAKNLKFVTCSNWLAAVARTSPLISDFEITAIPNAIDTDIFSPGDKQALRKKWGINPDVKLMLFGAANILDRRKGIIYLEEALCELKAGYPETGDAELLIFGKNKSFDTGALPFLVHQAGVIGSQQGMAELYQMADVYLCPTIEDNLPNTVMESLACGTPVVAFDTGGLPDMVEHRRNGYLAEYKSAADFAAGINEILAVANAAELAANARKKVLQHFTNEIVAGKYWAVYQSLLNQ